ncbi:hypothetical protein AX777_06000 [Sphingobium yanoikuyae]|uniref:Uncharacterized protein n=1 Tax=Sphingobium yanoikuyae TaxID=13690 RepID=A0A177JNH2_SPHYA|nr:hypothetical protein [Sphingobium yanoikuyae]OAH42790.1 hypothetical protein AX777_06000 [Sphingobium yanoikuyae]
MAGFNWKAVAKKAADVDGFGTSAVRTPKTAQEVVAAAIDKQIVLFNKPRDEGRRWFEVKGDQVGFSIRYANSPLKLVGDETKIVVPKAQFVEVMEAIKADVLKGDFKAQLEEKELQVRARADKIKGKPRK